MVMVAPPLIAFMPAQSLEASMMYSNYQIMHFPSMKIENLKS